jgi:hypothetical protein
VARHHSDYCVENTFSRQATIEWEPGDPTDPIGALAVAMSVFLALGPEVAA